jgi:hypothetical protein
MDKRRKLTSAIAAGLILGTVVAVAGCNSGNSAAGSTSTTVLASPDPAADPAPDAAPDAAPDPGPDAAPDASPTASGSCEMWPGIGTLNAATVPLREAAEDIEENGYEDSSDQLAVNVAVTSLANEITQLPQSYAQEIQNEVIEEADAGDASQLLTAASNAESIATALGQLCYTP